MRYGITLTLTAVLVVFFALAALYLCYGLIGRALSAGQASGRRGKKEMGREEAAAVAMALEREMFTEEEAAAVAMALEAEGYGEVHDLESFVITIKR